MCVSDVEKDEVDFSSTGSSRRRRINLAACIIAIVLTTIPRGVAQETAASDPDVGNIGGTVEDANGAVIPKADLTLRCSTPCRDQSTVASDLGGFEFRKLALGIPYQVTATANGFKEWTSPALPLTADHSIVSLTSIRMQLEDAASVTVYASQEQIATEQVRIEERQRVLGIVPTFLVVYDAKNALPLSSKMKFRLAMRIAIDPVTIGSVAILAGIQQAGGAPDYVQGAKGYGQRLGANAADGASDILIGGALLPSLLHQDPGYFYQGTGTTKSRLKHALFSPFICRGDSGKPQVNFSSLGGDLASSALSNTYYPESNRGPRLIFGNCAIGTAERMLSGVMQEFVLRRFTPSAKSKSF